MHDAENNSVKWDDYVEKRANEKEEAMRIERENRYLSREKEWLLVKPEQQKSCTSNLGTKCYFLSKSGKTNETAYCRMGWDIIAEKGKKPIPKEPCVCVALSRGSSEKEDLKRFIAFHGYDRFRKSYWQGRANDGMEGITRGA